MGVGEEASARFFVAELWVKNEDIRGWVCLLADCLSAILVALKKTEYYKSRQYLDVGGQPKFGR
jgi:hypothetical protein